MLQDQSNATKDEGGVLFAPKIRELPLLADQLSGWLRGRLGVLGPVQVTGLEYPRGAGGSHETILFDADWTDVDGSACRRGMVVRIKPTTHKVFLEDHFEDQFKLLQLLHGVGRVRVPEPLYYEPDPSLLGAPFFVMAKVAGRVAVTIPPYARQGWLFDASPAQRRVLWEDSVRQLAAIQTLAPGQAAFLRSETGPAEGFGQEWARWASYLDWVEAQGEPLDFLREAQAALEASWPVHRPEGIVWGDSRLGNMIIDDTFHVGAVVDWEHPSLGGALHDLGWWTVSDHLQTIGQGLPPLEGMGSRAETIALWEEVCGKSARDFEWYEAFAAFKMACTAVRMSQLGSVLSGGRHWSTSRAVGLVAEALGLDPPGPAASEHARMSS